MFVCCVLSGRGLCNGLITHSEVSYRLWRVVVCDQETSWARSLSPAGLQSQEKKSYICWLIRVYHICRQTKLLYLLVFYFIMATCFGALLGHHQANSGGIHCYYHLFTLSL
jgi:hypothetical protein